MLKKKIVAFKVMHEKSNGPIRSLRKSGRYKKKKKALVAFKFKAFIAS